MCDNVRMIPTQRQQSILSELHEKGAVRVSELSIQLGVSPMTVRRDIEDLAGKGLLKRVHGGAVSASTLLAEPLFSVKSRMETAVKQAIAAKAVEYVAPGDVIAVGGGSTTYAFAQCLLESKRCEGVTILTNSIPVAQLAHSADASGSVEVIMTGGAVTRSNSLVGPIADKVIRGLRVNTLFTGAHSVSLPRGFLTPNSLEAATNSALISIADLCIALVDHTKWDSTSLSLFADFSQIDTVITDSALSGPRRKQTSSLVKHLVTV
ncbi:MAG: DeoR/GlpR family DNA-binding transcription regulator [Scardovia wiggsiae]